MTSLPFTGKVPFTEKFTQKSHQNFNPNKICLAINVLGKDFTCSVCAIKDLNRSSDNWGSYSCWSHSGNSKCYCSKDEQQRFVLHFELFLFSGVTGAVMSVTERWIMSQWIIFFSIYTQIFKPEIQYWIWIVLRVQVLINRFLITCCNLFIHIYA